MNKIYIGKKIVSDSDKISINGKQITFLDDDLYEIEYLEDGKYDLVYNLKGNATILEYSFDKKINNNNRYVIDNGIVNIYKFYNNLETMEKIDIDLCSIGSKINYRFTNISRVMDNYMINVNHLAEKTESDINNKTVALINSKTDFIINSKVIKKALKSVLNQNTRIVTMGDCDTRISPNMFIDLEDVEAKHGSVIGTFKDEDIFYIMSKGINYNDTLKLLVKGFVLSNILQNHEIRKKIIDIIDRYWR